MTGTDFSAAVAERGLRDVLESEGGLIQVVNFLPDDVALDAMRVLDGLKPEEWELSAGKSAVDAEHQFW
eukprot:CAMPEP_0170647286 /NCGR_PEP_ID=MMETSP0224-20130122/44102_1 /TAXON_ID=285029 /ORGANISM="Togula jolla, Strain CCCM 725" /LENGTH=68 /DNA_ID=CAMNT_0010978699 /DNA_START=56 /DNA_END=259 /DNA_ORIENTATION=-